MSVASRNMFALLEDEDASRPSTPVSKPAAAKADSAPGAPTRGTQKTRGGPASRGGRYYQRGGKSSTQATQDGAEDPAPSGEGDAPKRKFDRGERGRGRGRGDRGGRGGRGGGRPFDRHSQTGKFDSEKKVSQGWGADEGEAELKAETAGEGDAAADALNTSADASGWGAPAADAGDWDAPAASGADEWAVPTTEATPAAEEEKPAEGRRGRDREPEEEDNTLTLDEYLKQQKEKELAAIPKLEPRKANEGDDSIWKDAVLVSKKDEDESAYFVGGKAKSAAPKARTKKEEKVYIEIDARFERPARGGRGGRGGERGGDRGGDRGRGRGRGGGRGRAYGNGGANGLGGAPTVELNDQSAFPSLS
ncbi:hypothetical protein FOMPIDRAFT_1021960 [Fomitopsis schrenkii]|uniref:Hyaluronan/mRNA-binding protein domain-containing protein n=1 Tax=Fomitopsis schrenkii TaxID=2126942 RepID=S8EJ80_FOMSC|nr:hypothetical protein FOMPIDRAFT_1021960 [Fomitopsis schrenkii]